MLYVLNGELDANSCRETLRHRRLPNYNTSPHSVTVSRGSETRAMRTQRRARTGL